MKIMIALLPLLLLAPSLADAGSATCQTRKSGNVTITTCSGGRGPSTTCRSYISGNIQKTSCRS